MYPYPLFLGLDLYSIFIMVGVFAAMAMVRVLSDRKGLKAKLQNFVLLNNIHFCARIIFIKKSIVHKCIYRYSLKIRQSHKYEKNPKKLLHKYSHCVIIMHIKLNTERHTL